MANLQQFSPIPIDSRMSEGEQINTLQRSMEKLYEVVNSLFSESTKIRDEYDRYVRDRAGLDKDFSISADFDLTGRINYLGGRVVVTVDSTTGNVTVTLPDARKHIKNLIIIKKTVATNLVTITPGISDQTIDGEDTVAINILNSGLAIYSDGTNWKIS